MENVSVSRKIADHYIQRFPGEVALAFDTSEAPQLLQYLNEMPADHSIEMLSHLNPDMLANVLELMDADLFKQIFSGMDTYMAAKLLSRIEADVLEEKLTLLPEKKVQLIYAMLSYPADSAGFLMDTRIISFQLENTVSQVLGALRKIGNRKIINLYITDENGILQGTVFIHTLAISTPETVLKDLLESTVSVPVMAEASEVVALFEQGLNINLPVVDGQGVLLGIIRNDALVTATQQDAAEDVMAMFGAGREERALSSPWFAVRKRLPWLQINLATAFLAASIVGIFEDTIAKVTVLAVFLPVVAGQSGNTGSQALAVTIRGLALREIQLSHWWKVARKELFVGFVNGIAVALTTSIIVYFWASSFGLALVIGTSMVLSMVIAGFSGAVVPIILTAIGQDPAQSSSIVLTTVTDIMGFLSFLGLTTVLGSALGII